MKNAYLESYLFQDNKKKKNEIAASNAIILLPLSKI